MAWVREMCIRDRLTTLNSMAASVEVFSYSPMKYFVLSNISSVGARLQNEVCPLHETSEISSTIKENFPAFF